jgi:hypothetical protein
MDNNEEVFEGLAEEDLKEVYNWVDEIPLSRPKRNIARDFSDGVLQSWSISTTTAPLLRSPKKLTTGTP